MKILVIGGSYFYGRVFTMLTSKQYELTLLNRGTYSMKEFGVKEITGDRNDKAVLDTIEAGNYDVVVDFCAYSGEDVSTLFEFLPSSVKQYILISTVDVYKRGTGEVHIEDFPYEERTLPGEVGNYISGKVEAEKVCKEKCAKWGIHYTILRPAILYGPYNYAPRESAFIQIALQNRILPKITDADGRFQFVYVKDAAEAIIKSLMNEKAFNEAFNLCEKEIVTYQSFIELLRKAMVKDGKDIQILPIDSIQAMQAEIQLPFPVTDTETELCDANKSIEMLEMKYTSIENGMEKTYQAFKNVFG